MLQRSNLLKTIFILVESPFSERDIKRFGIDFLSESFNVIVLDCTQILKKDFYKKYKEVAAKGRKIYDINHISQITSLVESLKNHSLAIDMLGSCLQSNRIRASLQKNKVPRMILKLGLTPSLLNSGLRNSNKSISIFLNSLNVLKGLLRRFRYFALRSSRVNFALCSGLASLDDWRAKSAKHKIWAHSFDYDVFLEQASTVANCAKPYAVFLDEDMVYHSDYDHASLIPPATEMKYFSGMNAFFDTFEKKYGLEVIIAAHPRARYDLRPGLWGDRKLISGETATLVKNASVVLVHQSTSVSYAVLWKKPIVYLTSNELAESFLGGRIQSSSDLLGALLINVDQPISLPPVEKINIIDEELYYKYKEFYIKLPKTPELPVWNIFKEYIKQADVF